MKNKVLIFLMVGMMFAVCSCKPTENNYKAAYDQARHKKNVVDVDADILNSGRLDENRTDSVSGSMFKVESKHVTPDDYSQRYLFVVAGYKIATNAKAHAESLKSEGYDAIAVRSGDEEWYVAAGKFDTEEEAEEFGKRYADRHKNVSWIGLTSPIIIKRP